ncbi:hypothetical protein [Echinicola salinicaeni]|uniref:hypothetical protein n=1 Tax=Echinicola salinicaeni TaxID=2762757 RepID=UPI0016461A9C|nr:hypothetical protein [Echinicola salinicaeni]
MLKFSKSKLRIFLFLVTFIISLIGSTLLKGIGIYLAGLDYIALVILFFFNILIGFQVFNVEKKYFFAFLTLLSFILINYFFSQYIPGLTWFLIGTVFTLLPLFTFIFFYNVKIHLADFNKLLDYIVFTCDTLIILTLFETIFIGEGREFLNSSLLKTPAFATTLSNISLTITLRKLIQTKRRKYFIKAFFYIAFIFSALSLKSIISCFIIIFLFIRYSNYIKIPRWSIMLLLIGLPLLILLNPSLNHKLKRYYFLYYQSENASSTPRFALYFTSFNLANDHFPMGSGQATFGSYPVNINYSDVYYDYNLNYLHGLGSESTINGTSKDKFLLDTYWSSILGEVGFLGFALFLWLYFYPIKRLNKAYALNLNNGFNDKSDMLFVKGILFSVFFESLVLAIPSQVAFILIYAGLMGLISNIRMYD